MNNNQLDSDNRIYWPSKYRELRNMFTWAHLAQTATNEQDPRRLAVQCSEYSDRNAAGPNRYSPATISAGS